ncbi:MAG: CocE/NonD family hydrolase [Solirubrobacterales bacterium]
MSDPVNLMRRGQLRAVAFLALLPLLLFVTAAPAAEPAPQLPPPTYETVSQQILIPMDDGVRLAATVTQPSLDGVSAAPGRFPVVLQMTPYGREATCGCFPGAELASRGMVSAVVDVRGTGGSEGTLEDNYFSPREQRDGYLLVEHFGTRPYSSGRVGMTGGSYLGITQYLTAEQQPPHLAAISPIVALSDLYREGYTHEGIPNWFFDMQYLAVQQPAGLVGLNTDPDLLDETIAGKIGQLTATPELPFDYLSRPTDGPFYRERSPLYDAARIQVPVLIYDGWHDGFIFGADHMYRELSKRRGVETRLYVDPCTHKGCGPPFDPANSYPNLESADAVVFEFLRKYLMPNTETPPRPPVRVYVQGRNQWLDARRWPPPEAQPRKLYLTPPGPAGPLGGVLGGAGTLTASVPAAQAIQSYATNPADGLSMTFDQYGTVAASPYIPLDQRLAQEAGLTWRTPTLTEPLTLAGPAALRLVASSTADDTDWFAKLSDVAPDGSEKIITAGFLRASHRALDPARTTADRPWHTNTDPEPIEPGRFYRYDLAIWPTAYELGAGHRLQLRINSFDFPTHLPGKIRLGPDDPAATSVEPMPPALNTVSQGGASPSYLRIIASAPR